MAVLPASGGPTLASDYRSRSSSKVNRKSSSAAPLAGVGSSASSPVEDARGRHHRLATARAVVGLVVVDLGDDHEIDAPAVGVEIVVAAVGPGDGRGRGLAGVRVVVRRRQQRSTNLAEAGGDSIGDLDQLGRRVTDPCPAGRSGTARGDRRRIRGSHDEPSSASTSLAAAQTLGFSGATRLVTGLVEHGRSHLAGGVAGGGRFVVRRRDDSGRFGAGFGDEWSQRCAEPAPACG